MPAEAEPRHGVSADALRDVLTLLRARTGHDFSNYKRTPVLRRIARHMQVNGVAELPAYLDLLHERADEVQVLLRDLLISVTKLLPRPRGVRGAGGRGRAETVRGQGCGRAGARRGGRLRHGRSLFHLKAALPGLRLDRRTALYQAAQKGADAGSRRVSVDIDGSIRIGNILVRPIHDPGFARGYLLAWS